MNGSLLPAYWTKDGVSIKRERETHKAQSLLTEVDSVGVEHRQTNKLLGNLWPGGNKESKAIAALEDSPCTFFRVVLCNDSFL